MPAVAWCDDVAVSVGVWCPQPVPGAEKPLTLAWLRPPVLCLQRRGPQSRPDTVFRWLAQGNLMSEGEMMAIRCINYGDVPPKRWFRVALRLPPCSAQGRHLAAAADAAGGEGAAAGFTPPRDLAEVHYILKLFVLALCAVPLIAHGGKILGAHR